MTHRFERACVEVEQFNSIYSIGQEVEFYSDRQQKHIRKITRSAALVIRDEAVIYLKGITTAIPLCALKIVREKEDAS